MSEKPPPPGFNLEPQGQGVPQVQVQQPGGGAGAQSWMNKPTGIPSCPPGLEYLTQVDQLLVHQQVELLEAFTAWETSNKYEIKNTMGQKVYFAAEESEVCFRQCCGSRRGFTIHITDNMGAEVIRVKRPFKCCTCCNCCACLNCCSNEVKVEAPVGTTAGYVVQSCSFLAPKFEVQDANHDTILKVEGPMCIWQGPCCTWDQKFNVYDKNKNHKLGRISKQWTGFVKEMFTKADNFGVSFPMDLDVHAKATLLSMVFLIDFMFFEQEDKTDKHD